MRTSDGVRRRVPERVYDVQEDVGCRGGAVTVASDCVGMVESRMGAVAWGLWPAVRYPSPLVWGFRCQGSFDLFWRPILWFDPRREHSSVPTACTLGRRAQGRSRT